MDPNTNDNTCVIVLRKMYGPMKEKGHWRPVWISEKYCLYKGLNIVDNIKVTRLGWAGHIIRVEEERIPTKVLIDKLHNKRSVGKPRTRWEDVGQMGSLQVLGI